jgi:hypothetical protein
MPWQPNKPLAGDLLSQSQADLQGNFQALDGVIDPTNPTVKLGPIGVLAPIAGKMQVYAANDPVTGHPQIYIEREQGAVEQPTTINLTASNKTAASGWTYLPSGMQMFWGTGTAGNNVLFADGGFDNACFSVTTTSNINSDNFINVTGLVATGFATNGWNTNGNHAHQPFYYIAIGW